MKTINDINFQGKRALIRVDFNVPLDKSFQVTDDNRIRATIPTIKKILKDGGNCVLMSHLGRPKEGPEEKYSLKHTIKTTEQLLGTPVKFTSDCIGEDAYSQSAALKPGEVLILENLRSTSKKKKVISHLLKSFQSMEIFMLTMHLARHIAHMLLRPLLHNFSRINVLAL
jgi:phosphoglycerate kinase